MSGLNKLAEVKIPRCFIGDVESDNDISIHALCDASQVAYATVIFVRVQRGERVSVHFVQAKNRVAPTVYKKLDGRKSIPRLELLAANIGARLTKSVLDALNLKVKVYYWSDSTTVLAWIERECHWDVFVGNRVKEIRALTESQQWRYVPGSLNPADLPSRGCSVDQFVESKWWEGPAWLSKNRDEWPATEFNVDESAVNMGLRKGAIKDSNTCSSIYLS